MLRPAHHRHNRRGNGQRDGVLHQHVPGTNYVLSYNTNLNSPTWFTVSSKTAAGTGDSQTDHAANSSQRHYRVYYTTP